MNYKINTMHSTIPYGTLLTVLVFHLIEQVAHSRVSRGMVCTDCGIREIALRAWLPRFRGNEISSESIFSERVDVQWLSGHQVRESTLRHIITFQHVYWT